MELYFLTRCPYGFEDLGTGCNHLVEYDLGLESATHYCHKISSHLLHIKSAEEQEAVANYLDESIPNGTV